MHFHLPKPLHGWREFAGEVGIIVVGVLIALAMEQAAESWHERGSARQARDAIRTEIGADLGQIAARASMEGCIERRFSEISAFLDAASSGTVPDPPTWIGRPGITTMDSYRWDAASQAGRVSLFSTAEQSQYSDFYAEIKAIGEQEAREQDLWAQLRSLEGQHHVSGITAETMRSVLSQARYADWSIRLFFREGADSAKAADIPLIFDARYPPIPSPCLPITTTREAALRMLNSKYGAP
jgi:hypothetical protein